MKKSEGLRRCTEKGKTDQQSGKKEEIWNGRRTDGERGGGVRE
jgi:hypothetical protein